MKFDVSKACFRNNTSIGTDKPKQTVWTLIRSQTTFKYKDKSAKELKCLNS